MISVTVEAQGMMVLPFAPEHYLRALEPEGLPDLLRAIEPDAREVSIAPTATLNAYLLNIKGTVAGCVPFNAIYSVTYPREPRPHVNVELMGYGNKDLAVIGRFFVQPVDFSPFLLD